MKQKSSKRKKKPSGRKSSAATPIHAVLDPVVDDGDSPLSDQEVLKLELPDSVVNIYDHGAWENFGEVIWPRSLRVQPSIPSAGNSKNKKTKKKKA